MSANLSAIFYLVSGVFIYIGFKRTIISRTSRKRKFFGIIGMIIAISVTFLSVDNFSLVFYM